ncbi:H-NS family nucleoid-associated regulatory protein [Paraburkholderia terrae]|uniref:H-NS family nucleoid-associated regulatory protein n=1 Tax=Paraburkholderia terrae TaxID=311230 RepID=UPI00296AFFA8|nr:H-NS family nucleoid-associated regulatory protein [Paraburkholderia terrae]MDW3657382.1 H-NS family nucleoid-associated regulatory protein [Paraburkholderia terrae]
MATLESLQAKIAKLQVQAEAIAKKDSSGVIAKIRDIMEKHGLTTADIEAYASGAKKRGRKPGVKAAAKAASSVAKYRDPKTGATWTGHGRAPVWIANAKDRTKFLVDATGATASKPNVSAKTPGKAAAKGKLPPKYINRKTGETWSGHARPPAWLKDVKDRSKFLIASGDEPTVAANAGVVSKAKGAAKKGASKSVGATGGKGERKGPQPALYRDPKSGSTWSGRGRAPAWLVDVKDRSKFLIDGVAASAAAAKASAPKTAGKEADAKKAAAKKAVAITAVVDDAPAVKETVAGKKAAAKKSPAARKKVAVKKVDASQPNSPVVRKAAAKRTSAVRAVTANTEATAMPEASGE